MTLLHVNIKFCPSVMKDKAPHKASPTMGNELLGKLKNTCLRCNMISLITHTLALISKQRPYQQKSIKEHASFQNKNIPTGLLLSLRQQKCHENL